jgi:N-acetylmuramoyl-L-alanine amidase
VTLNLSARRVFVGNVAVHFTAQVDSAAPAKLVMNFTAPVNPTIATEPGKLRMMFSHEAVVAPGSSTLTFDSKVIPSASFQENNGAAEVTVTSTIPLMASFSNDGRTITIASPAQAQAASSTAAPAAAPQNPTTAPASTLIASTSVITHYFAVIDAAHGGDERGAALTDQLAEKDVTLAFARRLNQELNGRGLSSTLLRNADTTLTTDQRADAANAAGAAIYISVHAATQGNGVRLYGALLPAGGENHGPFLDWNTAQRTVAWTSQMAEKSVATELRNRQLPARILTAPLRPLNNITFAAIAIELSVPPSSIDQLSLPSYQQLIATSVTDGLFDVREQLEAGRR